MLRNLFGSKLSFMAFTSTLTETIMETNCNIAYIGNNSWLIIGDLNELANPKEKISRSRGNSTR